jgi:hypothetical protein
VPLRVLIAGQRARASRAVLLDALAHLSDRLPVAAVREVAHPSQWDAQDAGRVAEWAGVGDAARRAMRAAAVPAAVGRLPQGGARHTAWRARLDALAGEVERLQRARDRSAIDLDAFKAQKAAQRAQHSRRKISAAMHAPPGRDMADTPEARAARQAVALQDTAADRRRVARRADKERRRKAQRRRLRAAELELAQHRAAEPAAPTLPHQEPGRWRAGVAAAASAADSAYQAALIADHAAAWARAAGALAPGARARAGGAPVKAYHADAVALVGGAVDAADQWASRARAQLRHASSAQAAELGEDGPPDVGVLWGRLKSIEKVGECCLRGTGFGRATQ